MNVNPCILCIGALTAALFARAGSTQSLTWQQRRLEHPTDEELQWEHAGHVMIYEGMTDREVERAMDSHFDRVQAMMFINTVVTNESGLPVKDPDNDAYVTEDDGCD
jgi:hypothetical protein